MAEIDITGSSSVELEISSFPVASETVLGGVKIGDNIDVAGDGTISVDLTPYEEKSNKVTSLSSSSTDIQYPSAKAVYDNLATKQPLKGSDDNYVTDAQLSIIQNTSGTNTGDETKSSIETKLEITATNTTALTSLEGTNTGDETKYSIETKLGEASTSNDGYLTSTDWNTFNDKEDVTNKETSALDTSTTKYPCNNVVKTAIDLKATDTLVVHLAGTETITGAKTFSSAVTAPSVSCSPTISSGSGAPSSTPTKVGDIYVDTTNYKTYIAKGASSSADWIKQNGSYSIQGATIAASAPADNSTYYFGSMFYACTLSSATTYRKLFIPRDGKITKAYIQFYNGGVGSNETSSIYINVNGTIDYLISGSAINNNSFTNISNTSMSVPVSAGDFITFKWVTPTWTTNPTSVAVNAQISVDI